VARRSFEVLGVLLPCVAALLEPLFGLSVTNPQSYLTTRYLQRPTDHGRGANVRSADVAVIRLVPGNRADQLVAPAELSRQSQFFARYRIYIVKIMWLLV
jgi:hypothetical protein